MNLFEINQSKLLIDKENREVPVYIEKASINNVVIFYKNNLYLREIRENTFKVINEKILKIAYLKSREIALFLSSPTKIKENIKDENS